MSFYRVGVERRRVGLGGLFPGLFASGMLTLLMLASNLASGEDLWNGLRVGPPPPEGTFDAIPIAAGMLGLLLPATTWSVLFGLTFQRLRGVGTVAAGLLLGTAIWIAKHVLLALLGARWLLTRVPESLGLIEHVLFGLAVAIGFLPRRRLRARSLDLSLDAPAPRASGSRTA